MMESKSFGRLTHLWHALLGMSGHFLYKQEKLKLLVTYKFVSSLLIFEDLGM